MVGRLFIRVLIFVFFFLCKKQNVLTAVSFLVNVALDLSFVVHPYIKPHVENEQGRSV